MELVNETNESKTKLTSKPKFEVIKPTKKTWLKIFFYTLLLDLIWVILTFSGAGILAPIIILIIILASLYFWNNIGLLMNHYVVIRGLKIWKEKVESEEEIRTKFTVSRGMRFILWLFGLNLSAKTRFYIENQERTLDLCDSKNIFYSRMIDLLSACVGLMFTVAWFIDLTAASEINPMLSIVILIIYINMAPIFVSVLIPSIWTIQDSNIRSIDEENSVMDLSQNVRGSIINRYLGVAGLLFGYSYLVRKLPTFPGPEDNPNMWVEMPTSQIYLLSLIFFAIVLALVAGTAYLVGMIYLSKYHEKRVNEFRDEAIEFLPIGKTSVSFQKK